MSNDSIFTDSEKNDKKYTVADALTQAKAYLASKGVNSTCVNAIRNMEMTECITMVELNKIQNQLVDDSFYYYS